VEEDYRQDYASVDDHHGFSGKTGLQKAVDYSVKLLKTICSGYHAIGLILNGNRE